MDIRLYGTVQDSIVDGPGLRYAVFVQGCPHACPGCHNPDSQPVEGGEVRSVDAVLEDIRKNPLIHGVTLSGGEPFAQAAACAELAEALKAEGYNIWTYTGGLFEDLMAHGGEDARRLIQSTDVLVDGPFMEDLKSLDLQWRGSSNQRLISVPETLASGSIVLWRQDVLDLRPPASW